MKLSQRWARFCLQWIDKIQAWAAKNQDPLETQRLNLEAAWFKQKIREDANLNDPNR